VQIQPADNQPVVLVMLIKLQMMVAQARLLMHETEATTIRQSACGVGDADQELQTMAAQARLLMHETADTTIRQSACGVGDADQELQTTAGKASCMRQKMGT